MGVKGDGSVVEHSLLHPQKRNLMLVGSATFLSCSASEPSLTVVLLDDPYAYIHGLLNEYVGDFTMDEEQERQFVDAFIEHYGNDKVIGFVALHRRHKVTR